MKKLLVILYIGFSASQILAQDITNNKFGKGLINYGNSVAQIGSLTYPTSNNFYNGDNKNIDTYSTDKASGGGVLPPQGFRKITKIEMEKR